jgi:membrane-bound lytic murein transglycosylase A
LEGGVALWQWQHLPGAGGAHADGAIHQEPVEFSSIARWADDDHAAALAAFVKSASCGGSEGAALASQAGAALRDGEARQFFETYFTAHRVEGAPGGSLLTGYFEPVLSASLTPSPAYAVPIYRRPPDLELAGPDDGIARQTPPLTGGRRAGGRLQPYDTRAAIEAGALAGQGLEIAYAADAVDLFVMHVQGSGLLKLAGGGEMRLTFAGKNGHPYTSLAKLLIERGELTRDGASLGALLAWLRSDMVRGRALMRENQSYIFFEVLDATVADGPRGSLGAPLTPGRSLAVDPAFHRLGLPIWVEAPSLLSDSGGFHRLMVAQDTGSAIRGAVRGDIFWGCGETAGALAGCTKHSGNFYVLLPKVVA